MIGWRVAITSLNTGKAEKYGALLLVVRQALFYSLILVVAGPPLVLLSLLAPAKDLSLGLRMLALLFGMSLTAVGIRKLRNRPVMMEITERGIMIHANAGGVRISVSLLQDLFIPWQRIDLMYYLSSKEVQTQGLWRVSGGWGKADPVIVIRLKPDAPWPAIGILRNDSLTRNARPGEIYLNVVESLPKEKKLWDQVRTIARRYGVSAPDDHQPGSHR